MRKRLHEALDPKGLDGIISMHLLESDPALSGPTLEIPSAAGAGAADWFWLIDHTDNHPPKFIAPRLRHCEPLMGEMVSVGSYRLLWDIAKADIS